MTTLALSLDGVAKSYGAVRALRSVHLTVDAGEVHAIVGENGAGKSTLMGVAAGSVLPDEGQVHIAGKVLAAADPVEARRLGLAIVYQHPALLPDLTVAENLVLAALPEDRPSPARAHSWAVDRLRAVGLDVEPLEVLRNLTLAQRHLLEIAKAMALEPKVLVLDEPTEPFTSDEIERLVEMIARVRDNGAAVVYISHRIPEVQRIADRISVLRDGEIRGTFANESISESDIVDLVVGRPIQIAFPDKTLPGVPAGSDPVLSARGLNGPGFAQFDLDVQPGEIVGLAGIEGNGQRDVIRALAGLSAASGRVSVDGHPVRTGEPSRAHDAGMLFIADDRQSEGLFKTLSIRENLAVSWLGRGAAPFTNRRNEADRARAQIDGLGIKLHSVADGVDTLSGGNQQKVVFGRALMAEPRVLLVDEPTHGVDAGARMEIYRIMRRLASQEGTAVIMLSSDAIELEGLCDRVLVFSRGSFIRELSGDDVTEAGITEAILTSTSTRSTSTRQGAGASAGPEPTAPQWGRLRRFLAGDQLPSVVLAILALLLVAYTSGQSEHFLTERNSRNTLMFVAVLVFVALGQQMTLMVGSIDLSVASTVSMSVVAASFLVGPDTSDGLLPLAFLALIVLAVAIGAVNAALIRFVRIPPVVATIVSFFLLSGLALWLRPTAGGPISRDVTDMIRTSWGPVPVAFIVAIACAVSLEIWSRRTASGMALRAIGSDQVAALRLGVREGLWFFAAHIGCSLLALAGAVVLMSEIGVGDPASGGDLTLNSIAAAFIGGASIRGGRGSFLGALTGALLLQLIVSSLPFLDLADEWQFWLVGLVTLVGAGTFTRLRARSGRPIRPIAAAT